MVGGGRGLAPLSGFSSSWLEDGCLELGKLGLQRTAGVQGESEQRQHM